MAVRRYGFDSFSADGSFAGRSFTGRSFDDGWRSDAGGRPVRHRRFSARPPRSSVSSDSSACAGWYPRRRISSGRGTRIGRAPEVGAGW